MKLVIDTNILFSFFTNSDSFKKFVSNNNLELYAPNKMISELEKYSDRICELSELSNTQFFQAIDELKKIIQIEEISLEEIESAKNHILDKKDAPFLALAVKLQIPIWSEDKDFKRQLLVKVFNFNELKIFLTENKN